MADCVSEEEQQAVAALLEREPRGLRAISVRDESGQPAVIRVASLVDGKPFPTLFWLVDKRLSYRIDQLEALGLIKQLQQEIDHDVRLRSAMALDHRAHIALRNRYMSQSDARQLKALGFYDVLQGRGIGGIEDFSRIRCLHTWYAAHLVTPNTVGQLLDAHWACSENQ